MLSQLECVGIIKGEPKRIYTKVKNIELSKFWLTIKRDDGKNKWDMIMFEAWDKKANYINEYLHDGDLISLVARPKQVVYRRSETGKKYTGTAFVVSSISFICHKRRMLINQFGGVDFPELQDIDYSNFNEKI